MFYRAILAGLMISFGGIIYLSVGGVLGAALFSVGLLSILHLNLDLFTGKAGRLVTGDISVQSLSTILLGNLCGTFFMGFLCRNSLHISDAAYEIVVKRNNLEILEAIFLGVCCGMLMYIATSNASIVLTIFCVTTFISCGFTHCIADSFYYALASEFSHPAPFIFTILGNIIGCNAIPLMLNKGSSKTIHILQQKRGQNHE